MRASLFGTEVVREVWASLAFIQSHLFKTSFAFFTALSMVFLPLILNFDGRGTQNTLFHFGGGGKQFLEMFLPPLSLSATNLLKVSWSLVWLPLPSSGRAFVAYRVKPIVTNPYLLVTSIAWLFTFQSGLMGTCHDKKPFLPSPNPNHWLTLFLKSGLRWLRKKRIWYNFCVDFSVRQTLNYFN